MKNDKEVCEFIDELVSEAVSLAARSQFPLHFERSESSEAVYLSVARDAPDATVWYGLRIAAHQPAHVSSFDFEQLILPQRLTCESRHLATAQVGTWVADGSVVVADPREVDEALTAEALQRRRQYGHWRLSNHEFCQIRHRVHLRAKWAFELTRA
ncbi:hypothetical protein [Stratiformator vulcanicus]|uniref:Uncharacterized protein n=1 Tax=Stratiformator vulcanicus TaxID=2527980 RepID=A0A517R3S3_9PLAN|nr:hypothetical protein [Stratiformator vulcanicus]QDT38521.1 hypothetical protein Pan189_29150 [Stratiformator vulcanicus]